MNLDEGPNGHNRLRLFLTACEEPLTRQLGAVVCWSPKGAREQQEGEQKETKDRFKTLQSISDLTQG